MQIIEETGKNMRYGFTTGSCAAAAAKAAAYMLLSGKKKTEITIETPKGIPFNAQILDIERSENQVSCAVQKDGGDDPDITTGALIYAAVTFVNRKNLDEHTSELNVPDKAAPDITMSDEILVDKIMSQEDVPAQDVSEKHKLGDENDQPHIIIDGGTGVGRVTKPGLDQPVGNAAINHVPREMITAEVSQVCRILDYKGTLMVKISVPEGEEIAKQTFNPRLGIVGGISILGTSGIVEPMSNQALLDTIRVELNQRKVLGYDYVVVSPGNYGLDFMKNTYNYDLDKSVKCSNFIGKTIDMAVELGFKKLLLAGHIGKLIKVAGGIMNTHSREADARMELMAAFAVKMGVEADKVCQILESVTTEEAVRILSESGKLTQVMDYAMERICFYLDKRARGKMQIDCIMYANDFGELAKSREVSEWFTLLAQEQEQ